MKSSLSMNISGEYHVRVIRKDGSIKLDVPYQNNMVLDNGINFLVNTSKLKNNLNNGIAIQNQDFLNYCIVGTGTGTVQASNIQLTSAVAINDSSHSSESGVAVDGDYYKVWNKKAFVFTKLSNVNLTEVGLCVNNNLNNYALLTRTLFKGADGLPITVSVLDGEILEITYQVNHYIDKRNKLFEFNVISVSGDKSETVSYDAMSLIRQLRPNYFLKPIHLNKNDARITSYGVLELDSNLTSDYSFEAWQSINIDNQNIRQLIDGETYTQRSLTDKANKGHATNNETIDEHGTHTLTSKMGVYSHVHTRGIRAFSIQVTSDYPFMEILTVVKNKANGQGIKKTDKQYWTVSYSISLSRKE